MTLQELIDWQRAVPEDRHVQFELGGAKSKIIEAFVYSYKLGVGQYITDISQIDLEEKHREKERKTYEELKVKYG